MRYWAVILFVGLVLGLPQAKALDVVDEPYSLSQENLLHVAVSYGVTFTFTTYLRKKRLSRFSSILISSLTTIALGTIKETLLDARYNPNDQIGNLLGVGISGLVVVAFEF